jgi:hypothetical protein
MLFAERNQVRLRTAVRAQRSGTLRRNAFTLWKAEAHPAEKCLCYTSWRGAAGLPTGPVIWMFRPTSAGPPTLCRFESSQGRRRCSK